MTTRKDANREGGQACGEWFRFADGFPVKESVLFKFCCCYAVAAFPLLLVVTISQLFIQPNSRGRRLWQRILCIVGLPVSAFVLAGSSEANSPNDETHVLSDFIRRSS